MSFLETRHIAFTTNGQTFLVPAYSSMEKGQGFLQIKFTISHNLAATDIEYVLVDNEDGYIRMVTSRGNEFTSGTLYDQLLGWYNYIVGGKLDKE